MDGDHAFSPRGAHRCLHVSLIEEGACTSKPSVEGSQAVFDGDEPPLTEGKRGGASIAEGRPERLRAATLRMQADHILGRFRGPPRFQLPRQLRDHRPLTCLARPPDPFREGVFDRTVPRAHRRAHRHGIRVVTRGRPWASGRRRFPVLRVVSLPFPWRIVFDSRRLHHDHSEKPGDQLSATAVSTLSPKPEGSSRRFSSLIAPSRAEGDRCMYRSVVDRSS